MPTEEVLVCLGWNATKDPAKATERRITVQQKQGRGAVMHTEVYGIIAKRGPAVQHRELYPIFCDNPYGERI